MKTYKDDGVASDDISNGQSSDKFHEGDQYARRENGHQGARVSRDSVDYANGMTLQSDRRKKMSPGM